MDTTRKRIWGWMFFDWASQPYNTLLITFIFAPYLKDVIGDGARTQTLWGVTIACAGIAIALLAPVLGAISDVTGRRVRWIAAFSVLYVVGACGVWLAAPGDPSLWIVLPLFAMGLVGMEFATSFTHAMLPDLARGRDIGRLSGNGWAFGYMGGLVSLVIMLLFFFEVDADGRTLIGLPPALGLDAQSREGTRAVGPFTALWYVVFMVPFFMWVRETGPHRPLRRAALTEALGGLWANVRALPRTPSRASFLAASMLYRDGLNGAYALGAVFAAGVLDWSVTQTASFGILAIVTGAAFAWAGGIADARFGPKPVIVAAILTLMAAVGLATTITPTQVLGVPLAPGSRLPDLTFMVIGGLIGAGGGALQAASRTMMVRQADPDRMAESFGLYALTGKATSFVAPLGIAVVTAATGSQQLGLIPIVALLLGGLALLVWVRPDGDRGERLQ